MPEIAPQADTTPDTTPPTPTAPKIEGKVATKSPEDTQTPEKRSWKVKVLDKEEELQLTDDETRVLIQKGKAADRKFEEAAKIRDEGRRAMSDAEGFIKLLQTGSDEEIEAAFSKLGRNAQEIAEKILTRKIKLESMDPKERELLAAKEERDRLLAEKKAREDSEAKSKEEIARKERETKLKNAIANKINAVLKDSVLPPTDRTVSKIAYYIQQGAKAEIPIDVEYIRDQVLNDYKNDFGHIFKAATPEQIVALIGEEKLKEIRKWDNERITGKGKAEPKTGLSGVRSQIKRKFKTPEQDNLERFGTLYPNLQD